MIRFRAALCVLAAAGLAVSAVTASLDPSAAGVVNPVRAQLGEPRAREPLTAVVLVDATASAANIMAPFVWDGRRDANNRPDFRSGRRLAHRPTELYMPAIARGLFPHLAKGDRLRVASFSRRFLVSPDFSGDRETLARAAREVLDVPEADRYGPSPIWDAIDSAAAILDVEAGRRTIILVTDGFSTGNRFSLRHVSDRAARARTRIIVVHQTQTWVGPGARLSDSSAGQWAFLSAPLGTAPDVTLRTLADSTGGRYIRDDSPSGQFYRDPSDGRYHPDRDTSRPTRLIGLFRDIMKDLHDRAN